MTTHTLVVDPALHDFYFGFHRDFETEICRVTGAQRFTLPTTSITTLLDRHAPIGVSRSRFIRKLVPKMKVQVPGQIVWFVLNNPSNFRTDIYDLKFEAGAKKILYVTDAFDNHMQIYKRIMVNGFWDLSITSIHGAKPHLERLTNQTWHVVPQGVMLSRFRPVPIQERVISICSYGRRTTDIHLAVKEYCASSGDYYDYSTWQGLMPDCSNEDHYAQYCWHLAHSRFSVSFPRRLTHPDQLSKYDAITVRHMELAASMTPIIGQLPDSPEYEAVVGERFYIPLDLHADRQTVFRTLRESLADHHIWLHRAKEYYHAYSSRWTWESRVWQILELL